MSAKATFTIGELAASVGLTRDALRYYERLGMIAPARRTTGGFRVYTVDVVERLRFIKQAQLHGLTLAEIRELLRLDTASACCIGPVAFSLIGALLRADVQWCLLSRPSATYHRA